MKTQLLLALLIVTALSGCTKDEKRYSVVPLRGGQEPYAMLVDTENGSTWAAGRCYLRDDPSTNEIYMKDKKRFDSNMAALAQLSKLTSDRCWYPMNGGPVIKVIEEKSP